MSDKYSRTGFDHNFGFKIYHQGGLDCFCGLYSAFNLVNFIRFYCYDQSDAVGLDEFLIFRKSTKADAVSSWFSQFSPFGGIGATGAQVKKTVDALLSTSDISASVALRHGHKWSDTSGGPLPQAISSELAKPSQLLGLACIRESVDDTTGHWIVLVGSDWTGKITQAKYAGKSIVLDPNNGYRTWVWDGSRLLLSRSADQASADADPGAITTFHRLISLSTWQASAK